MTTLTVSIRRTLTICLLMTAALPSAFSQEDPAVSFGKISPRDFDLPKTQLISNSTAAVVLADVGSINFEGSKKYRWFNDVYRRYARIKIINQQAFELSTLSIPLYGSDMFAEELDSLRASTYNLENGKVVETKFDQKDLMKERLSRSRNAAKLAFPAVKDGSIIEYSYKITSSYNEAVPDWMFQYKNYPCLYSKFEFAVPNSFTYLNVFHGQDSISIKKKEQYKQQFTLADLDINSEVEKYTWVMKDIPPFKNEDYLDHAGDYIDGIELYLLRTYNGNYTRGHIDWPNVTKDLLEHPNFGLAIQPDRASNLMHIFDKVKTTNASYVHTAQNIYAYIRDNFVCQPNNDIYLSQDLYEVNRKKKGTVADLNLLLVALLRLKGINASPVILTTTEYGSNPSSYPILYRMNYVICMMKMGDDTTFLDASQPELGFGKLPLNCYNGHARIINDHDTGSIFISRNRIKENRSTTVFIVNDENTKGKMLGTLSFQPGYAESNLIRQTIKRTGKENYFKNVLQSLPQDLSAQNPDIDSLEKLDDPVNTHFEFSIQPDKSSNTVYFTPIIMSAFKDNIFRSDTRKFPIEMPYRIDDMYVLSMEIPEGYIVDELPKSSRVAFNDDEGLFEYMIQKSESNIQLKYHVKLNKAIFAAGDYNSLRDFFGYIAKKQSEKIVFKKR